MEQSAKGTVNARDWRHSFMDLGLTALAAGLTFGIDSVVPNLDLDIKTKAAIALVLGQAVLMIRRSVSGPAPVAALPPTEKVADPRRT